MKNLKNTITGIFFVLTILAGFLTTPVPALALSQPTVTLNPVSNIISKADAEYSINFTLDKQLTGNLSVQDSITVTFPEGTGLEPSSVISGATIEAGEGWVDDGTGAEWRPAQPADLSTGANWTVDAIICTITFTCNIIPNTYIGEGAEILMRFTTGITNPAVPGDYALTVQTSRETTPVASGAYRLYVPALAPMPGIVTAYNFAGIAMAQSNRLDEAMVNAAGVNGRIEMNPGTYTDIAELNKEGLKVIGIGEDVIIDSAVAIWAKGITLENVTIKKSFITGNTIQINPVGINAIIRNVNIKASPSGTAIAAFADNITITDSTIDAGDGVGIFATNTTTIKNNTLKVTAGGLAIHTGKAGTVKNNTINGTDGTGILVSNGTLSLEDNILTNLDTALVLQEFSVVNAQGNTIDSCGSVGRQVIIADSPNTSSFTHNTISNSSADAWAFQIWRGQVDAHYNNLVNNPKNVELLSGTANFTDNWWGSPDGPAAGSIAGPVITVPFLPSSYGSVDDAIRHLPVVASKGQTFDVIITFTSPSDEFNSAGLSDFAPDGWTVQVDDSWCTPPADDSFVTGNRSDYLWYGPYDSGQTFSTLFKVTVPDDALPGTYSFGIGDAETPSGRLEYYVNQDGPFFVPVTGECQVTIVEGASVRGTVRDAKGLPLAGVAVSSDGCDPVITNDSGLYELTTPATGTYNLIASKIGYRNQEQTIAVSNPAGSYTCNFTGDNGLIPNTPNLSYVLACVNRWQYPPDAETGLTLTKVLAVINAWKMIQYLVVVVE